jgi:hypothetical protein
LLLALTLTALAAGCGASQREKTLRATTIAVNAARDGFVAWDLEHQRSIYRAVHERGGTKEAALAELATYHRDKREPVVELFVTAYRAIGVAAVLNEDEPSLQAAVAAAQRLADALRELMGGAS